MTHVNNSDLTRPWFNVGDIAQVGELVVRDDMQGGGVASVFVAGNPNGLKSGTRGQLAVDVTTGLVYQNGNGAALWSLYSPPIVIGGAVQSVYGDGSDGNATDPAPLTRDMFYNVLTLSAGYALNTGGFRLFALAVNGPATGTAARIHRDGLDGGDGSVSAGGAQVAGPTFSGTLGGCSGGASGGGGGVASAGGQGTTANGGISPWNGDPSGANVPGNSGSGGNGTGGNGPGARVDKAGPQTALLGSVRSLPFSVLMRLSDALNYQVNGGHDGPGGGGSTTGGGGAGGSGAAVVVVCARKITGKVSISARGGKGGNAHVGSGAGGGAGAGGGWLTVGCELLGVEVAMTAAGGAGSAAGGSGTGAAGTVGYAGVVQLYTVIG